MNDKLKAFYKKHQTKIKISVAALSVIAIALSVIKVKESDVLEDDLTEEEWDQIMDLARKLDENVAARKALKSK